MSERGGQRALRELERTQPAVPQTAPVLPEPSLPPAAKETKPPPSAEIAEPKPGSTASYRRRVLLTLSSIVLALFLFWASGYFFASLMTPTSPPTWLASRRISAAGSSV